METSIQIDNRIEFVGMNFSVVDDGAVVLTLGSNNEYMMGTIQVAIERKNATRIRDGLTKALEQWDELLLSKERN